jgi:hypothetical protein
MSQNNLFGQLLQSIAPQQNIKDYKHATRTFVDSLYRLSPKLNNLFHVFMDVNTAMSGIDQISQIETGLMAKSVQLPKFTIQNKTYNAYNRKTIQQERVNYDPVSITFHDDSADVVRKFWQGYFTHYYRDSDYQLDNYKDDSKYKQRQQQNWGFNPKSSAGNLPYLNAIRIYSLHQKRFSSYTLVRPMITAFQHGEHTAGAYEPMEHNMTIAYESVLYQTGPVSNGTVLGFGEIHYDQTPSPLRSLGGLIGQGQSLLNSIENGDIGSTVQNGLNVFNILTGTNTQLKQTPSLDLSFIGNDIMKGKNPLSSIFVPTSSTVKSGLSASGPSFPGFAGSGGNMNAAGNQNPNSGQGTN